MEAGSGRKMPTAADFRPSPKALKGHFATTCCRMGLGWEMRRASSCGVGRGRRPRLRASNPLAGNSRIELRAPLDRSASRRRRRRRTAGPVWANQNPTPKPRRLSIYLIAAKRPLFPSGSLGKSVVSCYDSNHCEPRGANGTFRPEWRTFQAFAKAQRRPGLGGAVRARAGRCIHW